MTQVNFNTNDFRRQVADVSALVLKNRYFEQTPFLPASGQAGPSLIARPGLRALTSVGAGPIRGMATEAGSFNGDLFVASYDSLYRMDNNLNKTLIYTGLNNPFRGVVNMAITASIGTGGQATPAYCFFADGATLFVYAENGPAHGVLSGTPADNDVVTLGSYTYEFTTGSVDAGTPDGSTGNPWLVNLGTTTIEAFTNLAAAVNLLGAAGIDYSSALQKNPDVQATGYTSTTMPVASRLVGILGNATVTTETGAALAFTAGTLTGGGDPTVLQVFLPDGIGAIDVAVINSYVLIIPAQDGGYQGRFYWVQPGEITVNPLDFATAERSPDAVLGVQVFGDQFWLPGEKTTEVWYVTGDITKPMAPVSGIVIDRGSWQSTSAVLHETLIIVDADGGVFSTTGSNPKRISTPDIEEQIRKAQTYQSNYLYP